VAEQVHEHGPVVASVVDVAHTERGVDAVQQVALVHRVGRFDGEPSVLDLDAPGVVDVEQRLVDPVLRDQLRGLRGERVALGLERRRIGLGEQRADLREHLQLHGILLILFGTAGHRRS